MIAQQHHFVNRRNLLLFYHHVETVYPNTQIIWLAQDNWPIHFHPNVLFGLQSTKIALLRLPIYDFGDDWLGLQNSIQVWLDQWKTGSSQLLHMVSLYPP